MKAIKKLGIWMDHSSAHIMEFSADGIEKKDVVESAFTHESKGQSLGKNENLMHNKEQHQQSEFYKRIGEVIKGYDSVILFGPTSAKSELFNLLETDHRYEKIKIEVKQTDKLTENQQHAFVKDYFSESEAKV